MTLWNTITDLILANFLICLEFVKKFIANNLANNDTIVDTTLQMSTASSHQLDCISGYSQTSSAIVMHQ